MDKVEKQIDNVTQRIYDAEVKLTTIRNDANNLKFAALGLKENATKLQEANVEGEYIVINISDEGLTQKNRK